jgi:hypothetical protein
LGLQCADLHAVKAGHKVGGDLSHFLFGHGLRAIGSIALKNILQCAAVLGRATIPEQLYGERGGRQYEREQD